MWAERTRAMVRLDESRLGGVRMFRRQSVAALFSIALVAACGAPGGSPSPALSGTPTAGLTSPTTSPSLSSTAAPTPSPTMIVRAYFLLDDPFSGGEVVNEPALVPVLRTVRKSTATAAAAM